MNCQQLLLGHYILLFGPKWASIILNGLMLMRGFELP